MWWSVTQQTTVFKTADQHFLETHSETKIALTNRKFFIINYLQYSEKCLLPAEPCSSRRKTQWENISYWQLQVHKMSNTRKNFNSLLHKPLLLHQNSASWFWKVTFSFSSQVSLSSLPCCHWVKNVKLLTYSFCLVDLNLCLFTYRDC